MSTTFGMGTTGAIDRLEIEAGGFTFSGRGCGPHQGRRVLLLHGFPQTSWAWRDELWALGSAGYRAVAPDQRGYCCGARPAAVGDYATERLLEDVLALADSMEMDTFDLVGHDWGGMLAWLVASRHPGRVRSLSVVSTPHPLSLRQALGGDDLDQSAHGRAVDAFCTPEVPERLLLGADGSGSGLATLLTESGLDDDDVRTYVAALTEPGALTAALNWYRAMDAGALTDLLPVSIPTLYVWSTGDRAFGRAAAEGTAEHVLGPYTFEVLEGVSHWVPETAPAQLSALLVRHLATT
jgi:pimeloyl-ACP methyl ester carboxylesterase